MLRMGAWRVGFGLVFGCLKIFNVVCVLFFMWNIERLEVYERVCSLIKRVYILIGRLPNEEKFALGDQMRRAVVSVKLNMIEGSGKRTSKDFVSYLNIARGSLREVRGQIEIGVDLGYFGEEGEREIAEIKRIERLMVGYVSYVEDRDVL